MGFRLQSTRSAPELSCLCAVSIQRLDFNVSFLFWQKDCLGIPRDPIG